MAMTVFRHRFVLLAGLLPALVATHALAAPPVPTPTGTTSGPVPAATSKPAAASTSEADVLDSLVKDSPFLPAAASAAAAGQNGPLELRSIIMDRGTYYFSLYDLNSKESFWVGLNETGFPALVRSYDRDTETVTVEQQGRSMSLTLAAARTLAANPAMAAQPQPGAPVATAGAPSSGGPTVQPSNGPQFGPVPSSVTPDEAQRLQRIADEIRRRRAAGKAAPSPVNAPSPSQNTPPKS